MLQVGALIEKWHPCSKEDRDTMRASALCAAMSLTHPEKPRLSGKTTAVIVVDDHENVADFFVSFYLLFLQLYFPQTRWSSARKWSWYTLMACDVTAVTSSQRYVGWCSRWHGWKSLVYVFL